MKPVSAWAIRLKNGKLLGQDTVGGVSLYVVDWAAEAVAKRFHSSRAVSALIIDDSPEARAVREAERGLEAAIIALLDSGGDYTGSDYKEALVPVEDYNDVCRAYDALLAARRAQEDPTHG